MTPIKQGDTVQYVSIPSVVAKVVSLNPDEILMVVENGTGRWPTPINYWRQVCPQQHQ